MQPATDIRRLASHFLTQTLILLYVFWTSGRLNGQGKEDTWNAPTESRLIQLFATQREHEENFLQGKKRDVE